MAITTRGRSGVYKGAPHHVPVVDIAPRPLVQDLLTTYPKLAETPGLLRLAVHVLRTPDRDGDIVLSHQGILSDVMGWERTLRNKKGVVGRALSLLRSALGSPSLSCDEATVFVAPHERHRRRGTGVKVDFPDRIEAAAAESTGLPVKGGLSIDGWCRVLVSGGVEPLTSTAKLRQEMLGALPDPSGAPPLSQRLQAHLNDHDVRAFQDLRKEIRRPETVRFVRTHYPGHYADGRERTAVVAEHLRRVIAQPVPVYKTSEKTARISAVGLNATGLPSALRQDLTERLGWIEFDLTHAQLACNAAAWGVGPALKVLGHEKYRFWYDLVEHVSGIPKKELEEREDLFQSVKGVLKRPVHGVSFGMTDRNLDHLGVGYGKGRKDRPEVERVLRECCGLSIEDAAARFGSHPVVAAMLSARDEQKAVVRVKGGREDVLQVFHKLVKARKKPPKRKGVYPRHVLARAAQAMELHLLESVIDDAIREATKPAKNQRESSRPLYRIVLWQHDGFTVSVKGRGATERATATRRLCRLVAARAVTLGIPTRLRVDVPIALDGVCRG